LGAVTVQAELLDDPLVVIVKIGLQLTAPY
jgi:hypothetical protein